MVETKNIDIKKLEVNKGQIEGLPKNPRFIRDDRYEALKKSISDAPEMLSLRELIVYPFNGKYVICGGNMRFRACKDLGHKEIPCKILDADTPVEKLREYTIKDNNGFGQDDFDLLANEWDVDELTDWGMELPDFDVDDVETEEEAKEDDFDEEKDEIHVVCQKGDVWQLGEHRLMCGDSISLDDVNRLIGGGQIDMIFTDPPYGMSAVSKSSVLRERYKTDILNDDDNKVALACFDMCKRTFAKIPQVWWGANYYTECLPSAECWLVWDKNNGTSDQTDCELAWTNIRSVVRQFTMVSEKQNRTHPTQKPVRLLQDIFERFSTKLNVSSILDLFGGSGTTMIFAEQTGRKSYLMELDPHYCDVIIARWEKLTGKKAEKIN